MTEFLKHLVDRLFERETLVTIGALVIYLVTDVDTYEEAAALIGTTSPLVLGRSIVKAIGR
jgi:hypothetical protein